MRFRDLLADLGSLRWPFGSSRTRRARAPLEGLAYYVIQTAAEFEIGDARAGDFVPVTDEVARRCVALMGFALTDARQRATAAESALASAEAERDELRRKLHNASQTLKGLAERGERSRAMATKAHTAIVPWLAKPKVTKEAQRDA